MNATAAVTGVATNKGDIKADIVVNCAGQWAKQVGRLCGVAVPLHSAEHMYIVTGRIDGVHPDLPVLRDPDGYIYVKEEVGGLLMGGFEPQAKPWAMDGIPENFEFGMLPDDWDQFEILMQNALIRLPALETAEIKTFMNGPESFTPDNNFIMGEAPELKNFFVGAGFNSIGIASGGGAGRALAEWIVEGEPTLDLWPVDIRRFARFYDNDKLLHDRVKEVLGLHYMMPWPNRELASARPFRRSPLYDRLAGKHARVRLQDGLGAAEFLCAVAAGGDDRLFARAGRTGLPSPPPSTRPRAMPLRCSISRRLPNFCCRAATHKRLLQRLCANDMNVPVGTSVYTGLLNERGTYESDVTVARIAHDRFLIVTGTAQATRDAAWINRNLPTAAHAFLTDVTSAYAVIAVMGPRSRDLLQRLTKAAARQRRHSRSAPCAKSASATPTCSPRGGLMSASWAGSCSCRSN